MKNFSQGSLLIVSLLLNYTVCIIKSIWPGPYPGRFTGGAYVI